MRMSAPFAVPFRGVRHGASASHPGAPGWVGPPRQSQVWAEEMRAQGKGDLLTYVELPDEDHGLRRYKATRRTRIDHMTGFLAEHLRLPDLVVR